MKKVSVAIVGMGGRGRNTYGRMLQRIDNAYIAAIADIKPDALEESAKEFGIDKENCYTSAEELLKQPKLADILCICTPDECHVSQAVAALEKGYHLLLEKPIATTPEDCRIVRDAANKSNSLVVVCHVLRYTPLYSEVKRIIDSGEIGEVVTLSAIERVMYWHQAHSFVRGNWRNKATSAPMILAKSCHDMDIIRFLMGKKCKTVSSFGSLYHFKEENAPKGSTARCKDCPVKDCLYNAYDLYLPLVHEDSTWWPANILAADPTKENVKKAIDEGPYGRCVYRCDNDVVDQQVVNMLFEGGVTANFTMTAFTNTGERGVFVMGTKGEIRADFKENIIHVYPFGKEERHIDVTKLTDDFSGHGGGDIVMLRNLVDAVYNNEAPSYQIAESLESHFMAFAAEESRLNGGMPIDIE